jgi:hypothetical protein
MARPRDDRQKDLLRPALEEIIDMSHPLVRLAAKIDWQFLAGRFSSVDLERVVVDTTVQPKGVAHPTDARLIPRMACMRSRPLRARSPLSVPKRA